MNHSILQHDRIHTLDSIRGFALLGIFLVNITYMVGNSDYNWTGADKYVRLIYDLLIQTKFYPIFSFLFGFGFYIFISRAQEKELRYNRLFIRRLLLLFIFGTIHYVIFWTGDILHTYALMGGLLLFFSHRQLKTILRWAIAFFCLVHIPILISIFADVPKEAETSTASSNYFVEWMTGVQTRAEEFFSLMLLEELAGFPEILALFLFGLYVGKKGIFYEIDKYRAHLRKWQIGSLLIGILLSIPIIVGFFKNETYVSDNYYGWVFLSGKPLAVFYITTFMLTKCRWLRYFRYVGKMALSNYIMQSLVGVVLLSLLMKQPANIPLVMQVFIVGFVYIVQIYMSKWWLNRYRFGPLEWLWRSGTYGQFQSMKKEREREKCSSFSQAG
jgi:uncharacterized protein